MEDYANISSRGRVMVIDDDIGMMDAMTVVLKKYNINVSPFTEPIAAMEDLKNKKYDILIINYLMNPVRGDEIVKLVREFNKEIYIILMSAHKELTPSIDNMRKLDIQAYFEKGSRFDQLILLIESGYKYIESIENVKNMSHTIEMHAIEIADILKNTVGAKDNFTKGHSDRVAEYSKLFGQYLNLSDEDLETLALAAQFHDVGKIGVSDSVLLKGGKLSPEEYSHMKLHPMIGTNILSSCEIFQKSLPIIRAHHERFNGEGYPDGIKGEQIPYLARILGITDSFDAITAKRPYKDATPIKEGLRELEKYKGEQFDPQLVDAFLDFAKITSKDIEKIHHSSYKQ